MSYSAHPEQGGGVILDLVHEVDLARRLFGEFDAVAARAGHFSSLLIESEDTACVVLSKTRGPPVVSISLDYVSRHCVRRYEIVGDAGTLVWDLDAQTLEIVTENDRQYMDNGADGFAFRGTHRSAMKGFLDCMRG